MIWPHATKSNPCPVCGKFDWCTFGDKATLCQRIESDKPAAQGGWYHFYGMSNTARPLVLPKAKAAPKEIDCASMMAAWQRCGHDIGPLVSNLHLPPDSLLSLGCAWSWQHNALAFPMKNGAGNIVGIRLRKADGFKWAVTGSRQGIFIPNSDPQKIAYLPEGPTDTAAMLTMGLFAIGRPSCNSGNEYIKDALKRLHISRVVVVADNDEIKAGNRRPGLEGAIKLKRFLGLPSVIWMPPSPIKDVREFLGKGGTKQMIESEIKNKVWSRL